MTRFKLLGSAVILSAAIATPVFAQQAVQEPGAQAFYQSLGVGSHSATTANAFASVGHVALSASPRVKRHVRASSKH
jgi:hypothetical protein